MEDPQGLLICSNWAQTMCRSTIGEIPKEWETRKIKYLYKLRDEKNYESLQDVQLLSLYTELGVFPHGEQEERGNKAITAEGYKNVYENDIVVNIILAWMGAIGMSQYNGVTSPAYDIYIPYQNVSNSRFYHYLFRTSMFSGECYRYGRGIMAMRWRTYSTEFKSIIVPFPTYEKQTAIANYLDEKCGKIDTTIQREKQHIEKLKEYRQSVITEAISKGLDPTAPMKDSGIEWIGEVPQGWTVGKLKYATSKIGSGKTPKGGSEVYSDEGILFLRSQNIYNHGVVADDATYISDEIDSEMQNTRVYKNDVLLNITGGSIGRCCIYPLSSHANVNQHVCIIRTDEKAILSKFIHYFWISYAGKNSIDVYQSGANREGLNFEEIGNTFLPYIPTLIEQTSIADYLDHKTEQIDGAIAKKETLIEKLTEYKKSLIYEAVTGNVEVS